MADMGHDPRPYPIDEDPSRALGPGHASPSASSFDPHRLDFGHHAGKTIEELALEDPDYLQWLERHPSGVRYRAEIHRVLGATPRSTDWRP
jgi:hypothetical protein